MRLPSLPRVAIGWRLLSGLLVIGLASLIYLAWTDPAFQVTALQINGLQRLDNQDIASVAGILGKPIYLVQPEKLQDVLQAAFPEIVSVAVAAKSRQRASGVSRTPTNTHLGARWANIMGGRFWGSISPRGEDGPSGRLRRWVGLYHRRVRQSTTWEYSVQLLSVDMVDAVLR
jgi:hypothetical protein